MHVLKPFDYFEPKTVKEATKLLAAPDRKGRVLAGGTDLIPRMRIGKESADFLVNVQKISGLDAIESIQNDGMAFGASVTLHSLERSKIIQVKYPSLYNSIRQISSLQIKRMGTAVGNICVATPASDVSTTLLALDAVLTIEGEEGERKESLEDFYIDNGRTSLQKGEFVTRVTLPDPPNGTGTAFMNLVRTHADIAKVCIAVAVTVRDGKCERVRIALGAVAPTVFRAIGAESVLTGQRITSDLIKESAEKAAAETNPITDLRSTNQYRKEVTEVLVRRSLEKAIHQVTS